ncbi:MAG: hypothetical protein CR980_01520 [Propionibacteriales bacterium]|nr:MAG: hypothetical protein CR980_01520 [Propionibacteriales bacterium]
MVTIPQGNESSAAPTAGWYPDPETGSAERYWDGATWTEHVRPATQLAPPTHQLSVPSQGGQGSPMMMRIPVPEAPQTADGVRLAGWGWRVLAYVIDVLVLLLPFALIGLVTAPLAEGYESWVDNVFKATLRGGELPNPSDYGVWHYVIVQTIINLVVTSFYVMGMLRYKSATLGMLACRLRVVVKDAGRSTEPLSWALVVKRHLSAWVMFQIAPLGLINVLFPLWDHGRQTLHDKVANTQVIVQEA